MRQRNDFFVGYLPIPKSLSRFYLLVVPMVMLVCFGIGFWMAGWQKNPGTSVDDFSQLHPMTGYLTVDPYPILHSVGPDKRSMMLVELTKKSAIDLVRSHANQWVTLSGYPLQRGDWSMLQLPNDIDVIQAESSEPFEQESTELGDVSFQGEIIDSKCFLGSMKPGGGKVHRACAALCLRGGIPPMLVAKNAAGERFGYLLINEDGSSASLDLMSEVAVPVALKGQLLQRGDLQYIKLNKSNIQRLAGQSLSDYGSTLIEETLAMDFCTHPKHSSTSAEPLV